MDVLCVGNCARELIKHDVINKSQKLFYKCEEMKHPEGLCLWLHSQVASRAVGI